MNEHQVNGTIDNVAGRIQDAAGALKGDASLQAKGKARATSGDLEAKAGDVIETVRAWASENPLNKVLLAAGVAFVLGRITANRD